MLDVEALLEGSDQIVSRFIEVFDRKTPPSAACAVTTFGLEAESFKTRHAGRNWRDVAVHLTIEHQDCLTLLSQQGFRYYTASFALASLMAKNVGLLFGESVAFCLTRELPDSGKGRFRLHLFDNQSQMLLFDYLRFWTERTEFGLEIPARRALSIFGIAS